MLCDKCYLLQTLSHASATLNLTFKGLFLGTNHLIFTGGVPKNDKKIVCRRQKLEKNCLQIVCQKKIYLHGNQFKEFANF